MSMVWTLRRVSGDVKITPRMRWIVYLVLMAVFAILIFFPRPYSARAKIVPQDTSVTAASTTSLLGALGAGTNGIGSLLTGGKPSNDLYLIIGRSDTVKRDVINTLKLVGSDRKFTTERKAMIWLERKVDIHLLLGGVMEIETKLYDPEEAKQLTIAYANAISRNLARFGRQIITNKRRLLADRFADARQRVTVAENTLDSFRRANNLADPEEQLGAGLSARAQLEGQLQAKEVELATAQQFRGPESGELAALRSDIVTLRAQVARTASPTTGVSGPNVAGLTAIQLRYLTLYRDLQFQVQIYNVYRRSAEQVEVEELAAESASYIQIIDQADIAPERQHNVWAIVAFAGIALLALFLEWYAPTVGLIGPRQTRATPLPEKFE